MIIHNSCNVKFFKALCIISRLNKTETYYIKRFLKQYCSKIIVNKNEYFKYH